MNAHCQNNGDINKVDMKHIKDNIKFVKIMHGDIKDNIFLNEDVNRDISGLAIWKYSTMHNVRTHIDNILIMVHAVKLMNMVKIVNLVKLTNGEKSFDWIIIK